MTHLELSDRILDIEMIAERLVILSQNVAFDYFGTRHENIDTKENMFMLKMKYHENSVKADMVLNFALDIAEKLAELGKCIDDTVPEYVA